MKRRGWIVALIAAGVSFLGLTGNVSAQSAVSGDVAAKIAAAEKAVAGARDTIAKGKELVALIPEDSPYMPEVTQMLQAAAANWKQAVESLNGATDSAAKIAAAPSAEQAADFALLAKINSDVALSGASVVQIGLAYVEAVATEKTEALDLLRTAMKDGLAGASQVQFYYEKIKSIVSERYSN